MAAVAVVAVAEQTFLTLQWDFYSWVAHTAPEIRHIELTMIWSRCNGPYRATPRFRDILDQLGMTTIEAEDVSERKIRPIGETISGSVEEFCRLLFNTRSKLSKITLNYKASFSWKEDPPLNLRTTTAVRRDDGRSGKTTILYGDTIIYDSIDETVQRVFSYANSDQPIRVRMRPMTLEQLAQFSAALSDVDLAED